MLYILKVCSSIILVSRVSDYIIKLAQEHISFHLDSDSSELEALIHPQDLIPLVEHIIRDCARIADFPTVAPVLKKGLWTSAGDEIRKKYGVMYD